MTRAAGDRGYRFELVDRDGQKRPEVIVFPSVTQVIKATLAAPQLVDWAYRQTVDSISGLLSVADEALRSPESIADPLLRGRYQDGGGDPSTGLRTPATAILEIASDAEFLDEWLVLNKLRPVDLRDERAVEGRDAHDYLEHLVQSFLLLTSQPTPDDPYTEAIQAWWDETKPTPVFSEVVVWSLSRQYAGTADLVWYDEDGDLHLTDLKTRRAGNDAYPSDHVQVSAYAYAWAEMGNRMIDEGTVLVAHDDGTWREEDTDIGPEAFLHLRDVYRILEGT